MYSPHIVHWVWWGGHQCLDTGIQVFLRTMCPRCPCIWVIATVACVLVFFQFCDQGRGWQMPLGGTIDGQSTQSCGWVAQQSLDGLRERWRWGELMLPMLHAQHLPSICSLLRRDSHFAPIAKEFEGSVCAGLLSECVFPVWSTLSPTCRMSDMLSWMSESSWKRLCRAMGNCCRH